MGSTREPQRDRTGGGRHAVWLVVVVLGAVTLTVLGGSAAGSTIALAEVEVEEDAPVEGSDDESPEKPPPTDGDGTVPDEPAEGDEPAEEESTEPDPEPADVPIFVWVGAAALVIVAVVWGTRLATSD